MKEDEEEDYDTWLARKRAESHADDASRYYAPRFTAWLERAQALEKRLAMSPAKVAAADAAFLREVGIAP